ncbi:unnamed protein product [Periconia digitata]|uniref:Uncharacterized protein n=1 Tax=Periconia digitata TaxID=1303443 RepID=A0A9W4UR80_9PLEO|nr:unnamed protein product [Periconia digitata]
MAIRSRRFILPATVPNRCLAPPFPHAPPLPPSFMLPPPLTERQPTEVDEPQCLK